MNVFAPSRALQIEKNKRPRPNFQFDLDGFTLLAHFYNDLNVNALLIQINISLHHIMLNEAARLEGEGVPQRSQTVALG